MRQLYVIIILLMSVLISCSKDDAIEEGLDISINTNSRKLKILSIGNSFTVDATEYLPWLIAGNNEKDVEVARLIRNSSSLEMHWNNHLTNKEDYQFQYINDGKWRTGSINTIDAALNITDWDIIVIQQVSGLSGDYTTYQPYLADLCQLFNNTNTKPEIAWHYTWSYPDGSDHPDFKRYDNDSETMYEAIVRAGNEASKELSLTIPSAQLIQQLREVYKDSGENFTRDGYHLSEGKARYAVACLWHDVLIKPYTGTSCDNVDYTGITKEDKDVIWTYIFGSISGR